MAPSVMQALFSCKHASSVIEPPAAHPIKNSDPIYVQESQKGTWRLRAPCSMMQWPLRANSRSSGVHDLSVRCMVTRRLAARRCGKRRSGPGCRAVSA
jgi:hypothetical protein